MGSYQMNIGANVSGTPSVDALGAATDKLTGQTSRLNEVLYGSTEAEEKRTLALIKLATEQAKVQGYTVLYNTALLENAAASNTATAATERLGEATGRLTGNTLAAGTALRVMEGAMPLRAAATFLGTIQALQPVLQGSFAVFGAVALVGVLDTIVEKTEKWANAHDPVVQAQKLSLSLLKEQGEQYDRLTKQLQGLGDEKLTRQFGRGFVDRLQSSRFSIAASVDDQDRIDRLQEIQSSLYRISRLTNIGGGNVSTLQQTPLNASDRSIAGRIRQVLGDDPKYKDQISGLQDLGSGGRDRPDVSQAQAAGELSVGVGQALDTARQQQAVDRAQAAEKAADADKDATRQANATALSRKELQNRATNAQLGQYGADPYFVKLNNIQQKAELEVQREDASAAENHRPSNSAQIRATAQAEIKEAIAARHRTDLARPAELADLAIHQPSIESYRDPNSAEDKNGFMQQNPALFAQPGLTGRDSPEEQLRRARSGASFGLEQATRADKGKSPEKTANDQYAARLEGIATVQAAEDRLADSESNLSKSKQMHADAESTAEQARFEAEMDREDALNAIIEKHVEEARSLAGGLFDAIHSHSTNQWTRAFGVGQEKALFENVASPIIHSASSFLGGVIPGQTNPDGSTSAIGKLLQGTVLSSSNADPAKTTATNTGETVKLLQRLVNVFTGNADPNAPVGVGAPSIFNGGVTGSTNPDLQDAAMWSSTLNALNAPNAALGAPMLGGLSSLTSSVSASSPLAAIASSLGMFSKGVGGGPQAAVAALFQNSPPGTVGYSPDGTPNDQWGNPIVQSSATQAGQIVSIAGAAATAAVGAYQGFEKGGLSGDLQGSSSILSLGAMIPGPVGAAFAAASAATALAASLTGEGPAQRAQRITDDIAKNQYLAPTALNVQQSMNGTYQSFDSRGNIMTSNMLAVPAVAEPYITTRELNGSQSWYDAPGYVTQPYQGTAAGTPQNPVTPASAKAAQPIIIQAMDAQSFVDFAGKNSAAIGEATATHLESHEGRLSNAIRFVAQT